jgi:enterochelin esterase family protein
VIPQVERAYRVTADPGSRAIAGFSMGATESLFVGLADTDRFAWIGAFSAGLPDAPGQMESLFDTADAGLSSHLRLLWMACGTDDPLIGGNRRLSAWLKARGVRHTYVETPGAHTPRVWRRNLAAFVPLLFQPHGPGDPR